MTNYASLDLDAGTSYVDVSPGGGSDGYNQYVSSRTVRNTANERSLLIGLYSLAGGFWLGLGASIVGYLNGNQSWDYAQKHYIDIQMVVIKFQLYFIKMVKL